MPKIQMTETQELTEAVQNLEDIVEEILKVQGVKLPPNYFLSIQKKPVNGKVKVTVVAETIQSWDA